MKEAILRHSCNLYLLEELDLSYCNLKEGGITIETFHLPSLQVLNLSGNNFCKLPPNISNFSKLRILKMSDGVWSRPISRPKRDRKPKSNDEFYYY